MKQSKYIILLLLGYLFCSCAGQSNPYDLDIPDKVNIDDVSRYQYERIKGSCIFVIPPDGFVQMPKESALGYKEACYIHFWDVNDEDGDRFIDQLWKKLLEIYASEKTGYIKKFEMNGYKAIATHSRYDDGLAELSVSFSGHSCYGQIKSVYPLKQTHLRDALLESMLTAYVDTAFKQLSMEEMAYYTIDLSNTDFKFAYYTGNTYVYSKKGIDPTSNPENELLLVIVTKPYDSPPEKIMENLNNDGFYPYKVQKKVVNGYTGLEYYSEGAVSGKTVRSYSVIFGDGNTSLYVTGRIYNMDLYDEYLQEIKRVIGTIDFKSTSDGR